MKKEALIEALGRGDGARRANGASQDDALAIFKRDHATVKGLFNEALAKEDGD